MATTIKRTGYGQVEPNHLSAQRTGQQYAQLIAKSTINLLENGQFVKYDYENREVNFTGAGEWLLVFNEIKNYDPRKKGYKYFAMRKTDYVDGEMVPRCVKLNVGDTYTTNTLEAFAGEEVETTGVSISVGDTLTPGSDGYLTAAGQDDTYILKVVAITTMPDAQAAVKLQRIS